MSTEISYLPGSEQHKFVEKDLSQTTKKENIQWIKSFNISLNIPQIVIIMISAIQSIN